MADGERVNRGALTLMLEATPAEMDRMLEAGLPCIDEAGDRWYPLREALEWVMRWAAAERDAALPDTLPHARARFLTARAELALLQLAVREGTMIPRLKAEAAIQHMESRADVFIANLVRELQHGAGLTPEELEARADEFLRDLRQEMGIPPEGQDDP